MTSPNVRIHTFCDRDAERVGLRALAAIWQAEGGFWRPEEVWSTALMPDAWLAYLAADDDPARWLGMLLARKFTDAVELFYIFVDPTHRGKKLGLELMRALIARYESDRAVSGIFLEVRKSNTRAIDLYEALGFQRLGIREKYYQDGEDAWVMRKEVAHDL